jgi:hypothetical protein
MALLRQTAGLTLAAALAIVLAGSGMHTAARRGAPPRAVGEDVFAEFPLVPAPLRPAGDAVLAGAGDIGACGRAEPAATAALLDTIDAIVFTLGDNAYPRGSARDFAACYEPTWGRHRARTRPAPGNHEYETAGAAAYFDYYGANAGPHGLGYYSYTAGSWLVLSLNSNAPASPGSPQFEWLRSRLSAAPRCTLAYWHHPLFSSGPTNDAGQMRDVWRLLTSAHAEIVLSGHDHLYERFAAQDADGRFQPVHGLRQFTVGTGGSRLYAVRTIAPNSELRAPEHGVLKLTLKGDGYEWEFLPIAADGARDYGTGACH